MRWCWVDFQCRGVLLIWLIVGQGPTVLAVGAGGGCLDIFTLVHHFFLLLWETARYRLKYCLKRSLNPKTTIQPTVFFGRRLTLWTGILFRRAVKPKPTSHLTLMTQFLRVFLPTLLDKGTFQAVHRNVIVTEKNCLKCNYCDK